MENDSCYIDIFINFDQNREIVMKIHIIQDQ